MRPCLRMPGIILALALFASAVRSTPTVAFPFNSQVPQVARKNQQYSFQISDSTFAPHDVALDYSISQQPAWLSLDSKTRTLRGTPGDGDVGSSVFTITAADKTGSAQMRCTLVIASEPAPKLQGDFTQQLAASINLTSNNPATVTVTPGTNFDIRFRRDSFIDIVQRKLYYYATLTNHTPLPSWLLFDGDALSFTGLAPQLSAFPQSFDVLLIASDYEGFSGSTASFTIVVATQQLTIVPSQQTVRFSLGSSLSFDSLKDAVYVNGQKVPRNDLQSATASLPSWLSFNSDSLAITGTPPQDAKAEDGTVTVTDKQGNKAQVQLRFVSQGESLFAGELGTISATPGETINYVIPTSVVNEADVELSLVLPSDARWLSFDGPSRRMDGVVPATATPTALTATLNARAPSITGQQAQSFVIEIESASNRTSDTTSSVSTTATGSDTAAALAGYVDETPEHLRGGIVAAIVICSVIGALLLIALLLLCYRRQRKRRGGYVRQTPSPSKRHISRPIPEKNADHAIMITKHVQRDVEKDADADADEKDLSDEDKPPQIAVDISNSPTKFSKFGQRASGLSQMSSIGHGEETIIRDNNIPEWGQESSALHKPHDSFSIPVAMAKSRPRTRSMSPAKRLLQRLTLEKRQSKQSIGLGIDTGEASAVVAPLKTKRSKNLKRKASSLGMSGTGDRGSCASFSTQATSLLSTRPSDFPRPPTQSTVAGSRPTLISVGGMDGKRRSIRFIRRTDSVDDPRPLEQKRESFIRNRASASVQSPLFSHGSRIPSDPRGAGRMSSSEIGSSILNRGRSSRLTGTASKSSYSQSSSRDAGDREERRLSQRIRSAFAPNFPRVISRPDLDVYKEDREAVEDDLDEEWEDVTPPHSRTNSAADVRKLAAEMAKPRHMRSWVLPGEASPTPPPVTPAQSQKHSARRGTPVSETDLRMRWRERVSRSDRSSSPLTNVVQSIEAADDTTTRQSRAPKIPSKSPHRRYSHLNEPLGLVAKDSLSRGKGPERPRLVQTKSGRPLSVDRVQRLSSLKAEPQEDDTQAGSENVPPEDDDVQGTGVTGPERPFEANAGTQKSHASGKAFL